MVKLKDLAQKKPIMEGGHRMCLGCGAPILVNLILRASDAPVVLSNATGCLEVASTIFPYTAWNAPWIHSAFENAAATISGIESMYRAFKKKGKIDKKINFVAFGGDGGTYDIGFQALSGALERGHRFVYVCYDNGAYMNTGVQRSSATPFGAATTTSPAGVVIPGKLQKRKDLTKIVAAHNIPYVAQASPHNWLDLAKKAEKAFSVDGPAFLNVIAPCPPGWKSEAKDTIGLCKIAVDTCFWPLYEVENGKYTINYKPKEKAPIEVWLKPQGRFRHLFKPENAGLLKQIQEYVDKEWESLQRLAAI
ncbi:MAG: pyruvate ferredoxin oxidoreductase [Nitrospirae bacterium]|nr:pyruvate ferredoxin oxidoreductase [Nitrospirota bacterium]